MEFIGTIAIIAAIIFISYRIGAIKFAQSTSENTIILAGNAMDTMVEESFEKQTRKLGKIHAKYGDKDVKRATIKELKALRKAGFNTATNK